MLRQSPATALCDQHEDILTLSLSKGEAGAELTDFSQALDRAGDNLFTPPEIGRR